MSPDPTRSGLHDQDGADGEALWDAIHDDEGYRAAVGMADPQYWVDSSIINQIATEVVRVVIAQGWRPPQYRETS